MHTADGSSSIIWLGTNGRELKGRSNKARSPGTWTIPSASFTFAERRQLANGGVVPERELIIARRKLSDGDVSWTAAHDMEYECCVCHRCYKWRSSIIVHVRTHTGKRPYQCRHCHLSFADSSSRKKHEWSAHERGPKKLPPGAAAAAHSGCCNQWDLPNAIGYWSPLFGRRLQKLHESAKPEPQQPQQQHLQQQQKPGFNRNTQRQSLNPR